MAALQCEICGGKLIGKPGGVFECDSCGMEYSTEWAKAKIQEIRGTVQVEGTVEVTGTVKVEGGANKESLLKRGYLLLEDSDWKAFPLDRTARALVYGVTERTGTEETGIMVYQTGPYVTNDDNDPLIPEIREGFYRLIDRHAEAGETDLLNRASLNFTLALYDTDTNILYFCEMDT